MEFALDLCSPMASLGLPAPIGVGGTERWRVAAEWERESGHTTGLKPWEVGHGDLMGLGDALYLESKEKQLEN